jgi:TatD DNase family protein
MRGLDWARKGEILAGMEPAFFDTHTHLQDGRYGDGLDAAIDRALAAGVRHMAACGTSEGDWPAVLALAERRSCVVPLLGLHPWFIQEAGPQWFHRLARLAEAHAVGIGECGLDFAEEGLDREAQEAVFRAQLQLARDLDRPLSIHCRRAWERLEALAVEVGLPQAGAVVHAFSGSAEVALRLQRLGFHISFACSLANPANKRVAKAVVAVALDRLLLETDSPDIPPRHLPEYREGRLNEPANIRLVAEAAARLRGQQEAVLAEETTRNARAVFGGLCRPA